MWDWVLQNPLVLSAFATIGLVIFAGTQIGLEISRRRRERKAAADRIRGPAWLARRTCEVALNQTADYPTSPRWAKEAGSSDQLDPLESRMLEVLHLAAGVGGNTASKAAEAFASFALYSDYLNRLGMVQPSGKDPDFGSPIFTSDDDERAAELYTQTVMHLRELIDHLTDLAPRHDDEPRLLTQEEVPDLGALISGEE